MELLRSMVDILDFEHEPKVEAPEREDSVSEDEREQDEEHSDGSQVRYYISQQISLSMHFNNSRNIRGLHSFMQNKTRKCPSRQSLVRTVSHKISKLVQKLSKNHMNSSYNPQGVRRRPRFQLVGKTQVLLAWPASHNDKSKTLFEVVKHLIYGTVDYINIFTNLP
jgi:hypothetical protein